jgi:D-3-phosphoglycerate dehydrogenase
VASHVMALLLDLNRKISFYNRSVRSGGWEPYIGDSIQRLRGKTCGLVSLGSIPQAVVPMLKGFGIKVVFFDPGKTAAEAEQLDIMQCSSLEELLSISDIVSLHTPLFPATKNMINEKAFAQMKEGAILINTSRGELVDEQDLINNLKSKKISAAGLDVLVDESNHDSELISMDNVIVTPHVGFLSKQSLMDSRKIALEQIVTRLSKDEKPIFAVNKNIQSVRQ